MTATYTFPPPDVLMSLLMSGRMMTATSWMSEKGYDITIVRLAAERFAGKQYDELGVEMQAELIVYDLSTGVNGTTGKPLLVERLPNNMASYMAAALILNLKSIADENYYA